MSATNPSANLIVSAKAGRPYYEAKFRYDGKQVKLRVGPAWLDRDPATGGWIRRRGRVLAGFYDQRRAQEASAEIVARYVADATDRERVLSEQATASVTFREVANAFLVWQAEVKGAKPSTLRDYGHLLAEPGVPRRRRSGVLNGHIMAALGDRPAAAVTTREVEALLSRIAVTGVSARTVNRHRQIVSAIFGYGMRGRPSVSREPRQRCRQAPRAAPWPTSLLPRRGGRGSGTCAR